MGEEKEKEKSNVMSIVAIGIIVILGIALLMIANQRTQAVEQARAADKYIGELRQNNLDCEAKLKAAYDQQTEEADSVDLVYVKPTIGCGDLCQTLQPMVEDAAEQIGFQFRAVALPANISYPGMYVMSKDMMSEIFPIKDDISMNYVFCNRFNITERCLGPTVPQNNSAPVLEVQ